MFIYAFSVIDMQLMHGTRAAIPGLAFQDEPGWYIDIGFDKPQSATEDWFKVAGLIGEVARAERQGPHPVPVVGADRM